MNDNGEQPPPTGPTDEQKQQLIETITQGIALDMWLVAAFAPHFPEERFGEIVEQLAREQYSISEDIMPSFMDPQTFKKHPILHVKVMHIESGKEAVFPCYKRLDDPSIKQDPQLAIASAMGMAFLQSPVSRFLLKAYGYHVRYLQSNDPLRLRLVT